jgi:hypothetical protein
METNETATSATDAQPGSATGETLLVSVADAAAMLQITPQAVRKRIAAGHLHARKVTGAWQIALEPATDETGATATAQPAAQPRRATSQPVAQSEADRYAAIVAPFLDRLEAQAQRIGYLEAELTVVTAQLDQLQAPPESRQDAGSGASDAVGAAPEERKTHCGRSGAHRAILAVVARVVGAASPVGSLSMVAARLSP